MSSVTPSPTRTDDRTQPNYRRVHGIPGRAQHGAVTMIPSRSRADRFDRLSVRTMGFPDAVPTERVTGVNATVYETIDGDGFIETVIA